VELHWILRRAYKVSRDDVATIIRKLLDAQELSLQEPDAVRRALRRLVDDVDFSDALIRELDAGAGCAHTITFDSGATRVAGMKPVPRLDPAESQ
jgi:predicted nucleic-acid-binding protein